MYEVTLRDRLVEISEQAPYRHMDEDFIKDSTTELSVQFSDVPLPDILEMVERVASGEDVDYVLGLTPWG